MTILTSERTLIERARDIMPRRAVNLTEAYAISDVQTVRLLRDMHITEPPVRFDQLLALPNLEFQPIPNYKLDHIAGLSRFAHGKWLIMVDANDPHGRRRFTLAHEFKHVIDHSLGKLAYARLGFGDPKMQQKHIEAICQHFAASLLMPKTWVVHWWTQGFQDVYALAGLFGVSLTAMHIRLRQLGLMDFDPQRPPHTYFRHSMPTLDGVLYFYENDDEKEDGNEEH